MPGSGTRSFVEPDHTRVMIRFEEVLAEHPRRPLQMSELCELIGVTDRNLRACCAEFIGISPSRYVLLRRPKQVRVALRDADPVRTNVAQVAHNCGFTELGRIAGIYQAALASLPRRRFNAPAEIRLAGS
jgi:transcriptional regulator GlxA family with amidase domain